MHFGLYQDLHSAKIAKLLLLMIQLEIETQFFP